MALAAVLAMRAARRPRGQGPSTSGIVAVQQPCCPSLYDFVALKESSIWDDRCDR